MSKKWSMSDQRAYRWEQSWASVRDGRGPERIYQDGEIDKKFKPRGVGFLADLEVKADEDDE